jgi:hypothetical protein
MYLPLEIRMKRIDLLSEKTFHQLFHGMDKNRVKDAFCERFTAVFEPEVNGPFGPLWIDKKNGNAHILLEKANRICENKITLWGREYDYGQEISWHKDLNSGHEWNIKNYYTYSLVDLDKGIDIKFPWELNRLHHCTTLSEAYYASGNETYVDSLLNIIRSWIKCNPFQKGINWACTMEVALRLINLIWSYFFVSGCKKLTLKDHIMFQNAIVIHGIFIAKNLENKSLIRGNHYLADLLGLLYITTLFPYHHNAKNAPLFLIKEFCNEIKIQFNKDGSNFEGSIPYHGFTTEILIHGYLLAREMNTDNHYVEMLSSALNKAGEYIACYTRPDGFAPLVGDNDSGKVLRWGCDKGPNNDHRNLVMIIDAILQKDEVVQTNLMKRTGKKPYSTSVAFESSGVFLLRNQKHYLLIKNGRIGTSGKGPHNHNDNLHIEVCIDSIPYLTDPGTFSYARSVSNRNLMRSNKYHNTIQIDDIEQNEFNNEDPFICIKKSEPADSLLSIDEKVDVFVGKVRYFKTKKNEDITHERKVELKKTSNQWIVTDAISGTSEHTIVWSFHTRFNVAVNRKESRIQINAPRGKTLCIDIGLEPPYGVETDKGIHAPEYGTQAISTIITITKKSFLPCKASFVIGEE